MKILLVNIISIIILNTGCINKPPSKSAEVVVSEIDMEEPNITDRKENVVEEPKLMVLSLYLINENGNYSATITNSTILITQKSFEAPDMGKWNENDFVCFLLDKNKQTIDTLVIIQPLHPRFEHAGEDGSIHSNTIEIPRMEVLLRFSYSPEIEYIQVGKVEKDGSLSFINTLKL